MDSVINQQHICRTHQANISVTDIYFHRKNRRSSVELVPVVRTFEINLFNILITKLIIGIHCRARLGFNLVATKRKSQHNLEDFLAMEMRMINILRLQSAQDERTVKENSSDIIDVKTH